MFWISAHRSSLGEFRTLVNEGPYREGTSFVKKVNTASMSMLVLRLNQDVHFNNQPVKVSAFWFRK